MPSLWLRACWICFRSRRNDLISMLVVWHDYSCEIDRVPILVATRFKGLLSYVKRAYLTRTRTGTRPPPSLASTPCPYKMTLLANAKIMLDLSSHSHDSERENRICQQSLQDGGVSSDYPHFIRAEEHLLRFSDAVGKIHQGVERFHLALWFIRIRRAHKSGNCQSISGLPASRNSWLMAEKGRLPKKPLRAESGDGWADWMMVWREVSIRLSFFCA